MIVAEIIGFCKMTQVIPQNGLLVRDTNLTFNAPILDQKRKIEKQEDQKSNKFQFNDVPGPGCKDIQKSWKVGFVSNEKIITANHKIKKEYKYHVDICPNKNSLER